ncbi:TIGR03088 family PEP-CTERM/XrtA system glycosyltransferase [Ideonella sp. DXS22W]|uniref:TIGR03088 family PEP-CTERM/XrtA system glycosyltransferase n=1 Tax=Pseudaquabacterium inlustre TaxID=2984192 RepID=A0ABU9CND6_9BURK
MGTSIAPGQAPLVVHVVYRFDTGGLENGVVNLINHMPAGAYRHAVVALTEVAEGFARRVRRSDVEFVSLHKPPGHGAKLYPRLVRLLRQMRPAVLHTRNLAALECQVPGTWVGVPARVHGEHGRDVEDLDGSSRRHQWMRRIYSPFVHQYVALSQDLTAYLTDKVRIAPGRVNQVYNGVDISRFAPAGAGTPRALGCPFGGDDLFVLGTVGRMQTVKAQTDLARAFVRALELQPAARDRLRLVMVGEGPLRAEAQSVLDQAGVANLAWLPGERADVPDVMRALDCFVLPSLAEGISNTILEAMACRLPVVATAVGGNAELVQHERTGLVVPAGDVDAMARAMLTLAADRRRASGWGLAGRERVEREFSLQAMVVAYQALYDRLLARQTTHA